MNFLRDSYGWRSKDSINKARTGLIDSGLLTITRYGRQHTPTLYALNHLIIDVNERIEMHIRKPNGPIGAWRKLSENEIERAKTNAIFRTSNK